MKRFSFFAALVILLTLLLPLGIALADTLSYAVADSTIVSNPSGGTHSVKIAGDGTVFVDLDASTTIPYVYTFELNTWVGSNNPHPTYPVTTAVTAKKLSGDDLSDDVKLLIKDGDACQDEDYSSATKSVDVTYTGAGNATTNNVVLCVQVSVPLSGDLNDGMNQVAIVADSTDHSLGDGRGVAIRLFRGAEDGAGQLFWMSDSSWIPQDEWNYTDAFGNPLGPNDFAIIYNKTKITSTNPGQFYANLWLENVTASNMVLHVTPPTDFSLSADPSGVSTKVYVGSSNINFADPKSQKEYVRNHSFTIPVGPVSNQDVYMTVHLKYSRTSATGLSAWPALNIYTFEGNADADGTYPPYDLANLTTTIYGVLKK